MAWRNATRLAAGLFAIIALTATAHAATCGNKSGGFERWKKEFSAQAKRNGIGKRGLTALQGTRYAQSTINADRNQKSFRYSLKKFMQVRGGATIAKQGKRLKKSNAKLFANLERRYGVPPGPLIAIWGMETAFGKFMGNDPLMSAVATLAYDCRRSAFFTDQLYAALKLVDRGVISPKARGAKHGELGQTQFLPKSIQNWGVDGDGNGRIDLVRSKADALASTANFLRAHGWRAGRGYQPGQPNYRAIKGWNAAGVYQQAIAIIAARIDG